MNKIAVPTENNGVADHFGRCPEYTIFEVDNSEIKDKQTVDNPGHKPGYLPLYLKDLGADCILACGMGHKAKDIFDANNIEVITGVTGEVDQVIELYLKDELNTEDNICDH